MQTAHSQPQAPAFGPVSSEHAHASLGEALSALLDGECAAVQMAELTQAYAASGKLRQAWAEYHWVGEALRGEAAAAEEGLASPVFVAGVMARLAQEPQAPRVLPTAPMPVAVGVSRPGASIEAANDAVFRWKLVAGMASFCAVAALAWQVAVAPSSSAPTLAQVPTTGATASTVASATPPAMAWVPTERGLVLRDPQLEALMAAHRQYGGVSALQMPAGFLRNATYDVPQR